MASSAFVVKISSSTLDQISTTLFVKRESMDLDDTLAQRGLCRFTAYDILGAQDFQRGQPVEVKDSTGFVVYSGAIESSKKRHEALAGAISHEITCFDNTYYADKRIAAKAYAATLAGDIYADLLTTYLQAEGIIGTRTQPAFTRTSIATRASDGGDVTSGNPRFEPGAPNMLNAQQSDIEANSFPDPDFKNGLGAGGSIARDTGVFSHGAASLRAISDGLSNFQSVSINAPASSFAINTTYTFSAKMKASTGTPTLRFYCQANDFLAGNTSLGTVTSVTLDTTFRRYVFSVTMPGDLSPYSIIGMRADTGGANQAITWYMDELQIQQGPDATPWTYGGLPAALAVRVEEATSNLLSANQSNVETNTTGFSAAASALLSTGATITRDTTQFWQGTASLKVVTTNALSQEGAETTAISATAATKYSAAAWVYATGTAALTLVLRDVTNSVVATTDFIAGAGWQRVSVTLTTGGSAVTDLRMAVRTTAAAVATFYVDGWQIEQKGYSTSWQVGGTSRVVEKLQLPAYGAIKPTSGTIQFRAYIDATVRRAPVTNNGGNLFGVDKGPVAGNGGAINLFHSNNTTNWVMNINSQDFPSFSDSLTPDGWHVFACAWDSASFLVYVDGVLVATQNNPHLPTILAPTLYIGSNGIGADFANTLFRDVRLSSRKRTAAEISADAALTTSLPMDADTVYLASFGGALTASTSIEDGPNIIEAIVNYAPVSAAYDKLAEVAQKWWNIDCNKLAHFRDRGTLAAPFAIVGAMMDNEEDAAVENKAPLYRNREYIPGGKDTTSTQIETRTGDGLLTAFTLNYPVAKVPTVEVKIGAGSFVAKTVGILGVDSGKDWYWKEDSNVLSQDSGGVKLTSADTLRATYQGRFPIVFFAEDSAQVVANQALEAGSAITTGYVEQVDVVPNTTSSAAAGQYAAGKLARFAQQGRELTFRTRQAGLRSGQVATITANEFGVSALSMLIQSVRAFEYGMNIFYNVSAIVGPVNSTWIDWFAKLVEKATEVGSVQVGSSGTLVIANNVNETWTWTESATPVVQVCLLCNTTTICGTGQLVC